jgi:hypothetical protein
MHRSERPSVAFRENLQSPGEGRLSGRGFRENRDGQIPSAPARPGRRGRTAYIFAMTASANALHFTSFAPSMRRAKS